MKRTIFQVPKYQIMTDEDIMTFGVHKGKKLANVPDDYLLWLYDMDKCYGALKAYIQDNLEVLRQNRDFKHNRDNPDNW